ncbi:MAG: NifB/NifX family molybdenum-iron cluster-binding protein, partial [Oceanobacter sp.]
GHANNFLIYRYSADSDPSYLLLEQRDVEQYCHGSGSGENTGSTLQKIITTLHDCRYVLCAKIGDGPMEKLHAKGIHAISDFAYEGIQAALEQLEQRFLANEVN